MAKRSISYRYHLPLLLECLEDRLALSGSGTALWTTASAPSPVSLNPAQAAASTPQAADSYGQSSTPTAPNSVDSTPDDDASYASNPAAPTGGMTDAPMAAGTTYVGQTSNSTGGKTSISPTASGSNSSVPVSSGGSTGTTVASSTENSAEYYPPQTPSKGSEGAGAEYYPASSYGPEYYAKEYVDSSGDAAKAAEQTAEIAVVETIHAGQPMAPQQSETPARLSLPSLPPASGPATSSNSSLIVAPAGQAIDARASGAHRSGPVQETLIVDTADAEAERSLSGELGGREETLAVVSAESDVKTPSILLSGAAPIDWAGVEHGLNRFFEHLEEYGRNLSQGYAPGELWWWLASGATATAVFELARRATQMRRLRPLNRKDACWLDDSALLLTPRDE